MRSERVLIVDDDALLCRCLARQLGRLGLEVSLATQRQQAIAAAQQGPLAALLCDVNLCGDDGLLVARSISEAHPEAFIIIMSGGDVPAEIAPPSGRRGWSWLAKPFSATVVTEIIRHHLAQRPDRAGL